MTPQQTRSVWLVLPGVFLYHMKHDESKDRLAWGMARDMAVDENDPKAGLLKKFKEELSSTGTISTSKSTAERMYALISSASKKKQETSH